MQQFVEKKKKKVIDTLQTQRQLNILPCKQIFIMSGTNGFSCLVIFQTFS